MTYGLFSLLAKVRVQFTGILSDPFTSHHKDDFKSKRIKIILLHLEWPVPKDHAIVTMG
jgi:hypothetical protein